MIYDITRTISPTLAVWPGDTPFSFTTNLRKSEGDSANLTTLNLTAHAGTHIDAPYHFNDTGQHPADLPLEPYIGKAHVITTTRTEGGIVPSDFEGANLENVERLLIHTPTSQLNDDEWNNDYPYPTLELVDWVAGMGIVLFGVDIPSVDGFKSEDLACHHRLHEHGILNLENLNLRDVPDGVYELIALPLKIADVCGTPVRAILRTYT